MSATTAMSALPPMYCNLTVANKSQLLRIVVWENKCGKSEQKIGDRKNCTKLRMIAGVPYGTRTRVTAVKGRCPGPLDEGDAARRTYKELRRTGQAMRSDKRTGAFPAENKLIPALETHLIFIAPRSIEGVVDRDA
jgi:hypothetical protein